MDKKYKQDANLLIKDAESNFNKKIFRTSNKPASDYKKDVSLILPTFKNIQDSWNNLVSGMGGATQKSIYTTYQNSFSLTDNLLHSLFLQNGMAKKISKVVSDDATKNGIKICNDTDNIIMNKFKSLQALKQINQADIYRRHYGGSIIIMGIDDGQELFDEVNYNNIKNINWIKVYARTDCYFTNISFSEDINSTQYGKPEIYTIVPKYGNAFNVHYSRVLEFKGIEVPTHLNNGYRYYWGSSVIESLWDTLKKCGAGLENIDQLLYEVTISIYKIKDLAKLMSEGSWDQIKKIIDATDMAKSTIQAMLMDSEDDYKRDSITFSGVKDTIQIFFDWLSGESEIPATRLFGKQAGGLNNEGNLELSTYYDMIKSHQIHNLQEQTQKLIDIINVAKEIKGNNIKDILVEFNSPYQLTETELLTNKKLQAEIDAIYTGSYILTAEEIRESRFENGFSYETELIENELSPEELGMGNKEETESEEKPIE